MIQQVAEKIKLIMEKMRTSQDRQKSYYDKGRKPLDSHLIIIIINVIYY